MFHVNKLSLSSSNVIFCGASRQNPFGLTIALDEAGSASGELFYDDGESEHTMTETYLAAHTFEGVSANKN